MKRRGFTLYELLVAMAIASILMGIVYTIYIKAARTFRTENMTVEQQNRARFAIEHLRRDIANAGFNGALNTSQDPNLCFAPNGDVRALTLQRSTLASAVVNTSVNKNINPLEFTLFGDYAGQGEMFYTESITGTQVTLQAGFETRITQSQFEHIWNATGGNRRYMRIMDNEQYEMLIPVVGNNYGSRTVTLATAPVARTGARPCGIQGFGQGLAVNSAHYVRYRLEITDATRGKTDLIREDLDINANAVIGTKLTVAEYVVDMTAYDFVFDVDATKLAPSMQITPLPDTSIVDGSGANGQLGSLSPTTQDLRFMTVKVTVRAEDEDPDFAFKPRQDLYDRVHAYEVYIDLKGSARTMTMSSQVFLQTLAMRNI